MRYYHILDQFANFKIIGLCLKKYLQQQFILKKKERFSKLLLAVMTKQGFNSTSVQRLSVRHKY